jgi:hypothetical protein
MGPVIRVYDDRSAYVSLLSAGVAPEVRLPLPSPDAEGDEVLEDLAVIVGVAELPQHAMDEIVGREHRTRIDEARLRGSLRIRPLERLEITMSPDVHPPIWILPESSW